MRDACLRVVWRWVRLWPRSEGWCMRPRTAMIGSAQQAQASDERHAEATEVRKQPTVPLAPDGQRRWPEPAIGGCCTQRGDSRHSAIQAASSRSRSRGAIRARAMLDGSTPSQVTESQVPRRRGWATPVGLTDARRPSEVDARTMSSRPRSDAPAGERRAGRPSQRTPS